MIEKHYENSPYGFVYNNPIKSFDQFGLDTLLVDNNGVFAENKLIGGDNDVNFKVSKKEREAGKINYNNKGKLRTRHKVSKAFNKKSVNTITINNKGTLVVTNNAQSRDVFNFLADNTDVEFSRIEYEDYGIPLNSITTAHNPRNESLGSELVVRIIKDINQKLISHTHNHPINSGQPSKKGENSEGNDLDVYASWVKSQGNTFRVFIRYNGVTREFKTTGEEIKSNNK